MQSIDPSLLKWGGELMIACASNLEMLNKLTEPGAQTQHWDKLWESVPGVPKPPIPVKDIDEVQRIWLAAFDAVPRRDYDNLKEQLAAMEEECRKLKNTLTQVTTAMTDLRNLPETMVPWIELAQMTMKSHTKWLSELGQSWQTGKDSRPEKESG